MLGDSRQHRSPGQAVESSGSEATWFLTGTSWSFQGAWIPCPRGCCGDYSEFVFKYLKRLAQAWLTAGTGKVGSFPLVFLFLSSSPSSSSSFPSVVTTSTCLEGWVGADSPLLSFSCRGTELSSAGRAPAQEGQKDVPHGPGEKCGGGRCRLVSAGRGFLLFF